MVGASLRFDLPISVSDWQAYCEAEQIFYAPAKGYGNIYTSALVEFHFGRPNYEQYKPNPILPGSYIKPPESATEIRVETGNVEAAKAIRYVAEKICKQFGGKIVD